ncbi:MAG: DUF4178 domain-containing protein [Acaryochloris sp. SU_5_25]|nr:DUF4178 domain-containing protein [Acaryochloris sp. SU_5_25]
MTYLWLFIIIMGILGIVLYFRQQSGKSLGAAPQTPALPSLDRTVFTLEIGDIVQHLETDWVVEGKLVYNDQGYTWLEYLLQDGSRRQWLFVEEDDVVEVALLEATSLLEVGTQPPPQITFANELYHLKESGTAQMTRQGSTLNRNAERCQYFDYQGSNHKILSIENWDGDIEVTAGQIIHPSILTLLPGDGRRIYGV